jgi:hypothetical protein
MKRASIAKFYIFTPEQIASGFNHSHRDNLRGAALLRP